MAGSSRFEYLLNPFLTNHFYLFSFRFNAFCKNSVSIGSREIPRA